MLCPEAKKSLNLSYIQTEVVLLLPLQYPEAKKSLMERGRQLLMKDGLLDEEGLKAAQEQQETLVDKAKRLGEC